MQKIPSPLDAVLADIQKAIDAKLPYVAIAVALTIPDICAALECDPGKEWVNQVKYEAWCTTNIEPRFKHFTARDCYRLRCGVLHRGNFGRADDRYDRVIFTPPGSPSVHDGYMKDMGGLKETVLNLDAKLFCQNIIEAARSWLKAKENDPNVSANLPNLVRLRPEGLPPYIMGVPVIA